MRYIQFDSSNHIKSYEYDVTAMMLLVSFVKGGKYIYENVSLKEFGQLCGADSIGSEFTHLIKNGNKKYRKIV